MDSFILSFMRLSKYVNLTRRLRFYVRMAAIARKIYLNKNAGVGQLAKVTDSTLSTLLSSVSFCVVVLPRTRCSVFFNRHSAATSAGAPR